MSFDFISIMEIVPYVSLEFAPGTDFNSKSQSFNARCTACNDKGYHLNINAVKNTFNCWHCGGGGVLEFFCKYYLGRELPSDPSERREIAKMMRELVGKGDSDAANKAKVKKTIPDQVYHAIKRAPDDVVDKTYSTLLTFKAFRLSEEHRENLKRRGLSDKAIDQNEYRSIDPAFKWVNAPEFRPFKATFRKRDVLSAAKEYSKLKHATENTLLAGMILSQFLRVRGCDLNGCPGFFKLKEIWFFNLTPGMLIPVRNEKGQVVSFQVRTSNPERRYLNISSSGLPEGVTEGITRIHFPRSNAKLTKNTRVLLTEGPLKADVALDLLGENVFFMAIAGVNNRAGLPEIFDAMTEHGITTLLNALDMDKLTNINVRLGSNKINRLAVEHGLKVQMMYWDRSCCAEKYQEFSALAKEQNVKIFEPKSNVCYHKLEALVASIDKAKIEHDKSWCDATKGIDDYLLTLAKRRR